LSWTWAVFKPYEVIYSLDKKEQGISMGIEIILISESNPEQ